MNTFPSTGFLRLRQVLSFYPVSPATWWAGVKTGRFPQPVRLGPRMTAWRVEAIRPLLEFPEAWKPECQVGRKSTERGARIITADALAQRIRRRLARVGKHLVAARSDSDRKERGDYYLVDIRGNPVEINIDLNQLGRELVVLKPQEQVRVVAVTSEGGSAVRDAKQVRRGAK